MIPLLFRRGNHTSFFAFEDSFFGNESRRRKHLRSCYGAAASSMRGYES